MKRNEVKKTNSKKVNQVDANFYKRSFIYNEFEKNIIEILNYDFDEELYEFIMSVIDINTIAEFSYYGYDVFDLDYMDYVTGNKCFFCFVKFDFDEFALFMSEAMVESYYE